MLKRIEILGFKSFADKTILEFPSRITAIVGPNGSGKSNIVDAIRWVMGEQSSKNIRLKESQDIIFAGTPKRPAMSLASVSLHLDNESGAFPIEYSEIAIGRKINRGGNSDFILNKSSVRLKDIVQLLAGAKLGSRGITIITQGSGDSFLRATPKERRELLEESLGLKETRLKKEDAERKMQETKSNIEKAATLLEEIAPHLRTLKRQYGRWEKRKEKETALHQLEEIYFRIKLAELNANQELLGEGEEVKKEIEILKAAITEEEKKFHDFESAAPQKNSEAEKLANDLSAIETERSAILRQLGKIEGQLEGISQLQGASEISPNVLKSLISGLKPKLYGLLEIERVEDIREHIKTIIAEIENVLDEKSPAANPAYQNLEREKNTLLEKLNEYETKVQDFRTKIEVIRKTQEEKGAGLRQVFEVLEEKRRALRTKEELFQEYQLGEERRKLKEADLRQKLAEAGWNASEFFANFGGASQAEPHYPEPFEELEAKIIRGRRELADIGAIDEELLREYEETEKRSQFLTEQKNDLEKAYADLIKLAEELEERLADDFSSGIKEISEHFQHYFQLIFGGGHAKLREEKIEPKQNAAAEDSEEKNGEEPVASESQGKIISPGIEISVDVPRKKIKSIETLSGGERALTSIALIFAIVGSNAPPFLVLDEIDAPLDEANSWRFSKLLKELSGKTQFIIITHNRATMEAADVLYGITMEEGASKVFSLKFEEAEKMAEQDKHANVNS